MDEVYPANKFRFRVLSAKEDAKENISTEQTSILQNITVLSNLAVKKKVLRSENCASPSIVYEEDNMQSRQTIERCSQSIFRSVTELSSAGEKSSGLAVVDMNKALKGLVSHEPPSNSGSTPYNSKSIGNDASVHSGNFLSECLVPGLKAPLDFTLKTKILLTSFSSVNRIHRSIMSSAYNGMPQIASQLCSYKDGIGSGQAWTSHILSSKTLHSWVYPQYTTTFCHISVELTSSRARFF